MPYFNPRPPCGERHSHQLFQDPELDISIHALHAESDCYVQDRRRGVYHISIHALHAESDNMSTLTFILARLFQSTPSMRRATKRTGGNGSAYPYFNPRPPCGERRHFTTAHLDRLRFQSTPSMRRATSGRRRSAPGSLISIHALHAESDFWCRIPAAS